MATAHDRVFRRRCAEDWCALHVGRDCGRAGGSRGHPAGFTCRPTGQEKWRCLVRKCDFSCGFALILLNWFCSGQGRPAGVPSPELLRQADKRHVFSRSAFDKSKARSAWHAHARREHVEHGKGKHGHASVDHATRHVGQVVRTLSVYTGTSIVFGTQIAFGFRNP